jgi:hypothetical protein
MDFVKERREWEERLARRAPAEMNNVDENGDEEMGDDGCGRDGGKEEGPTPLTEEEEIEALAQYLVDKEDQDEQLYRQECVENHWQEKGQGPAHRLGGQDSRFDSGGSYGSDEEDYDQLFMDVISASQEVESQAPDPTQHHWQGKSGSASHQDQPSSSMDLS